MLSWISRTMKEVQKIGLMQTLKKVVKFNYIKIGRLVGVDGAGNKYYENQKELFGQDRWVELAKWDYDASQIPCEWHPWLHHTHNVVPDSKFFKSLVPSYKVEHIENVSGTDAKYSPHNYLTMDTWRPAGSSYFEEWKPERNVQQIVIENSKSASL